MSQQTPFDDVFDQALKDNLIKLDEKNYSYLYVLEKSRQNYLFNNWLNENFVINVVENYEKLCNYENFKSYYPKTPTNFLKYPNMFFNWLKEDKGYGNLKWLVSLIIGLFVGWISHNLFKQ